MRKSGRRGKGVHTAVKTSKVDANGLNNDSPFLSNKQKTDPILIGPISDLLEDIKMILTGARRRKKNSRSEIQHFQALLAHYYPLIGTRYVEMITRFIYDAFKRRSSIRLSLAEIQSWWTMKDKT